MAGRREITNTRLTKAKVELLQILLELHTEEYTPQELRVINGLQADVYVQEFNNKWYSEESINLNEQ